MKNALIFFGFILLFGCAIGNQYDYRETPMTLPLRSEGNKPLVLSVVDLRPYVLNGDKKPNFVGLQRGGFGNPFNVTTASGNPMTDDMSDALASGLTRSGYQVVRAAGLAESKALAALAAEKGAARIALIKVNDWKSDIYMKNTLHCDMVLQVLDNHGAILAENSVKFVEAIGGAQLNAGSNAKETAEEFAKQMGYLFNAPQIRSALQ